MHSSCFSFAERHFSSCWMTTDWTYAVLATARLIPARYEIKHITAAMDKMRIDLTEMVRISSLVMQFDGDVIEVIGPWSEGCSDKATRAVFCCRTRKRPNV